MQDAVPDRSEGPDGAWSEEDVAAQIDRLAEEGDRERLAALLREEHPVYFDRGSATVVRLRGWALLALGRLGVSDRELVFVLEELDTGVDPYLVAAAARALRSCAEPRAAFAPHLARGVATIRYRDEPVSFEEYGEYALPGRGTTPLRELLATLAWLGPLGRPALEEVEALRETREGFGKLAGVIDAAVAAIRRGGHGGDVEDAGGGASESCCDSHGAIGSSWWSRDVRRGGVEMGSTPFEDQDGAPATYDELFRGHPSIVVFFYTRCDNPLKCSLTVSKLARVQQLMAARRLDERIHTAAITYDPAFDLPGRLRGYGRDRALRMDTHHHVLRSTEGLDALRCHFGLGVNFVESLVNRHRVEAFVLDREGRVAAAFERVHWDENELVDRAARVLDETEPIAAEPTADEPTVGPAPPLPERRRRTLAPWLGTVAALGVALFPKCPICWAAYLTAFGVAGLGSIPYSPWLQPVLAAAMLVNLGSMWMRGRATGRMAPFWLASSGALAIAAAKLGFPWQSAALAGVALTLAGSLLSVVLRSKRRPRAKTATRGWRRLAAAAAGS